MQLLILVGKSYCILFVVRRLRISISYFLCVISFWLNIFQFWHGKEKSLVWTIFYIKKKHWYILIQLYQCWVRDIENVNVFNGLWGYTVLLRQIIVAALAKQCINPNLIQLKNDDLWFIIEFSISDRYKPNFPVRNRVFSPQKIYTSSIRPSMMQPSIKLWVVHWNTYGKTYIRA